MLFYYAVLFYHAVLFYYAMLFYYAVLFYYVLCLLDFYKLYITMTVAVEYSTV